MNKKQSEWSIWYTVFLVPLVVVNVLPHGHAVDASHAQASAMFRLAVSIICGIGLLVMLVRSVIAPRRPVEQPVSPLQVWPGGMPEAVVAGQVAAASPFVVAYTSPVAAQWRCNRYALWHAKGILVALAFFALVTAVVADIPFYGRGVLVGLVAFPLLAVAAFGLWVGLMLVAVGAEIKKRCPTPQSVYPCSITLLPEGVHLQTPEKTMQWPWAAIAEVRMHDGDQHIWCRTGGGWFTPREAFASEGAGRRFHEVAVQLWQSNGAAWSQLAGAAVPSPSAPAALPYII